MTNYTKYVFNLTILDIFFTPTRKLMLHIHKIWIESKQYGSA